MKMKKGQGLSLNVIIIAVLALIVLVVLIVILSGKVGQFRQGVASCSGHCEASASACSPDENPIYLSGCDANHDGKPDLEGANYCCTPT